VLTMAYGCMARLYSGTRGLSIVHTCGEFGMLVMIGSTVRDAATPQRDGGDIIESISQRSGRCKISAMSRTRRKRYLTRSAGRCIVHVCGVEHGRGAGGQQGGEGP